MSLFLRLLDGETGLEIVPSLAEMVILLAIESEQSLGMVLCEAALHYNYQIDAQELKVKHYEITCRTCL